LDDLLKIPYLTTQQMIEVDRLMVEVFGIQLVQMMENAGRHLAVLARKRFLDGDPANKKVIVLAGSGGHGGGAMVSARNLHNWGAKVDVFLTKSVSELSGVIQEQAKILQTMAVKLRTVSDLKEDAVPDLIIDGIIGYSLQGAPRGAVAEMINWVNRLETPVLSLDVPSGLDAGTGEIHSTAIHATATMTLALPKTGLRQPGAENVGELYLADIGVPPELYENPLLKLQVGPIFQKDQVIRLS
jgi:NAD(P)H-hydrate epimerase